MAKTDDLFGDDAPKRKSGAARKPAAKAQSKAPSKTPAKSGRKPAEAAKEAAPAAKPARRDNGYSAKDIEVLEGLEPVRRRPGMYIGGTDEQAMHHLVAEVLDNAMDEAVAGHANRIELEMPADGSIVVRDNGRGIPVDPHPKYKNKSALEIIMTTLHSGGKFGGKVYATSGGLHGVGVSVVNALSETLEVEVARDQHLYLQAFSRGAPKGKLKDQGPVKNRRGTTIRFVPDHEIFGKASRFRPERLYRMARAKAYLFKGVEIRWTCAADLLGKDSEVPAEEKLHFPGGLRDYVASVLADRPSVTPKPFAGTADFPDEEGRVEWAIWWPADGEGFVDTYCNTVPTPLGGTHESGLRTALLRGLKSYGELANNKKASIITAEDIIDGTVAALSVFVREPQFQGQTKEKLVSVSAGKLVENAVRDHFDHWLTGDPEAANTLLAHVIESAEDRRRRKQDREMNRKSATRKLRLPGKLTDCTSTSAEGTEIFLVEGDSAGGSAKQARNRVNQAVLPLRGKILNVASATIDKLQANQEIADLTQALGCGLGRNFDESKLRYDRVVIMTDADVDGAHIASLLMTFFYKQMPGLIENGHLYLAMPPLYRLSQGGKTVYARDDAHKDELLASAFKPNAKVEVGRFKGLGEMLPNQLKETTMDPGTRQLLQVRIPRHGDEAERREAMHTANLVETLMGRKPEKRFAFIQDNAKFVAELDV